MRALIFGICCLVLSGSEVASQDDVAWVIGEGQNSCGTWTAHRSDNALHIMDQQWVLGFISGSNWRTEQQQAKFPDVNAVSAYIDNYCALNPLQPIMLAAAAVVAEGGGPPAQHDWQK